MSKHMLNTLVIELTSCKRKVVAKLGRQSSDHNVYKTYVSKLVQFDYQVGKQVVLIYCVGNTFVNLVGYPAFINGKSMQPGCMDRDWVWVNCWRTRSYKFVRGDMVVYTSPKDPDEYLIKRVIAVEGDTMATEGRYIKPMVRIPTGHIWVEGDNWWNSVDSNRYGPVSKGSVCGVASRIIWPPTRMKALERSVPTSLQPQRVTTRVEDVDMQWSSKSWLQAFKVLLYFIRT